MSSTPTCITPPKLLDKNFLEKKFYSHVQINPKQDKLVFIEGIKQIIFTVLINAAFTFIVLINYIIFSSIKIVADATFLERLDHDLLFDTFPRIDHQLAYWNERRVWN